MSVLDHLSEYRVARAVLPLREGGHQLLDGVAKTISPPHLEITFLPDQLATDKLNLSEPCQISFDVAGTTKSIKARINAVVSEAKLQLEMLEAFSHVQKRSYFRVEAELSISYWRLDEENTEAKSVNACVNISGGGLRFPVEEAFASGTNIGLEIVLDVPQSQIIECAAEVVRTYETGDGGKQLALKFVDLDAEDQDAIIAYCLAEQRKQLRLRVKVLGI